MQNNPYRNPYGNSQYTNNQSNYNPNSHQNTNNYNPGSNYNQTSNEPPLPDIVGSTATYITNLPQINQNPPNNPYQQSTNSNFTAYGGQSLIPGPGNQNNYQNNQNKNSPRRAETIQYKRTTSNTNNPGY